MPIDKQFAFIFTSNISDDKLIAQDIAHEIAHGTFDLHHTFSTKNTYTLPEGQTDNLMDYPYTNVATATNLNKYQWDYIHDPEKVWFAWLEDEEEGKEKKKNNFYLTLNGKKFENGDKYYTLYTQREIEFTLKSTDSSFNCKNIKWYLNESQVQSVKNQPETIKLLVNPTVFSKERNRIVVKDPLKNNLISIEICTYQPPYIVFKRSNSYNGEYFFDDGFNRFSDRLASTDFYDTILVGKSNEVYYAPVLGLNKDQSVKLLVDIKEFSDFALHDDSFKVIIKATQKDYIKLNGSDSLVLNAKEFNNLNYITIKARNLLKTDNLHIYAYIPSINKKIGIIEYYCRKKEERKVHLIYVKFKDERNYPNLDFKKLENFLNTYSMNQLFLEIKIDTMHFNSKYNLVNVSKNIDNVYNYLRNEKFGTDLPSDAGVENDYYFITNIDNDSVGGGHNRSKAGGIQVKWKGSGYGETQEEVTAHELGHWQGLPHTFRVHSKTKEVQKIDPPCIWVTQNEGKTIDNFMDYNVRRKSWFKFQLLNLKK
jgi:hypothetical protein